MTYKEFLGQFVEGKTTQKINLINRRCCWELYQLEVYKDNYESMSNPYQYQDIVDIDRGDMVMDDWL